jgi:DNA-binding MarR family transcriptional regulator
MAVQNQLVAEIVREKPNENNFVKINEDSIADAMKALTPVEFQVWMYLAKNKNGVEWEISPQAACNQWGIKVSSFHKAITTLKKAGYLVPKDEKTKTQYYFYERPKVEQKIFVEKIGE